ncbi:MAG: hypothetical protein QF535_22615 [Anaerolineales bacterium]|jgi:hypothetical protein|nr:hypothetical protein [Anaerolineales bacterium]
MEIVKTLYEDLNARYRLSKYDYSRQWLKKSKHYMAYIESTKATPSREVLFALYGEAIRNRRMWEISEESKRGCEIGAYKQHLDYFRNIEHSIEKEIRKQSLTI